MSTKKPRQKRPPRAIPTRYATGAAREAAVAPADARYVADLDGEAPNMHWVIRVVRDGKAAEIVEHCPNAQGSEVQERAAQLSRGEPTKRENGSWGSVTKTRARPGKRVKDGAIALRGGLTMPSPIECVERLVRGVLPDTAAELDAYRAANKSLDRVKLAELLKQVIDSKTWAAFAGHARFDQFINAVSEQLRYTYGIRRANDRI